MTRAESFLAFTASQSSTFVNELKTSPACEVQLVATVERSIQQAG